MKHIFLIRHCQANGQAPDAPLTEAGRTQADTLAHFLMNQKISSAKIVSSPYTRALQTIAPFAKLTHLEVETDQRLIERKLSEEKLDNWMEHLKQTFLNLNMKLKGGESSHEAMGRAIAALEEHSAENTTAIFVTHGNLMSLMLQYYDERDGFDTWQSLSNPDVYEIHYLEDGPVVKRVWENEAI